MKNEKKFEKPEADLIELINADIITTSLDEYDENDPVSH